MQSFNKSCHGNVEFMHWKDINLIALLSDLWIPLTAMTQVYKWVIINDLLDENEQDVIYSSAWKRLHFLTNWTLVISAMMHRSEEEKELFNWMSRTGFSQTSCFFFYIWVQRRRRLPEALINLLGTGRKDYCVMWPFYGTDSIFVLERAYF